MLIYSPYEVIRYPNVQSRSRIGHDIYGEDILYHPALYEKDSGQAGMTSTQKSKESPSLEKRGRVKGGYNWAGS